MNAIYNGPKPLGHTAAYASNPFMQKPVINLPDKPAHTYQALGEYFQVGKQGNDAWEQAYEKQGLKFVEA